MILWREALGGVARRNKKNRQYELAQIYIHVFVSDRTVFNPCAVSAGFDGVAALMFSAMAGPIPRSIPKVAKGDVPVDWEQRRGPRQYVETASVRPEDSRLFYKPLGVGRTGAPLDACLPRTSTCWCREQAFSSDFTDADYGIGLRGFGVVGATGSHTRRGQIYAAVGRYTTHLTVSTLP
jgi:hypothetical protein